MSFCRCPKITDHRRPVVTSSCCILVAPFLQFHTNFQGMIFSVVKYVFCLTVRDDKVGREVLFCNMYL